MKTAAFVGNLHDAEFDEYLSRIIKRFTKNTEEGKIPLFTTDVFGLFETYLANLPAEQMQHHNCNSCRQFITRFGGLATIGPKGETSSAIWSLEDAPELYQNSMKAMIKAIKRAKITGVFLSSDKVWGNPVTGDWTHFSVQPPKTGVFVHSTNSILNAEQKMAEKREDFITMINALKKYNLPLVQSAVALLKTDSLYRSEKVLGIAEWLLELHNARTPLHVNKQNILWLAVATAPPGFCHPSSSMIGTLLDDISDGMEFSDVSRRFKAKMSPLQYQRPQAAPSKGNVLQAERIVEKLGIADSLKRRFARLDEIKKMWQPTEQAKPEKNGVFGHLKTKDSVGPDNMVLAQPTILITWDKFQRTVLPNALSIEFLVPGRNANYGAITTAVNPEAPPILQWDTPENRNPFAHYIWVSGSSASQWGLIKGAYCKVNAITYVPSMWNSDLPHHNKGVMLILDGAKESVFSAGIALFPEILKHELREIRSVIEEYSKNEQLEGKEDCSACGLLLSSGSDINQVVRVKTAIGTATYNLDRWD